MNCEKSRYTEQKIASSNYKVLAIRENNPGKILFLRKSYVSLEEQNTVKIIHGYRLLPAYGFCAGVVTPQRQEPEPGRADSTAHPGQWFYL